MPNPLQVLAGALLLFVAPGFLLLRAVLPGGVTAPPREERGLQLFLTLVLSLAVTTLVGVALGIAGLFEGATTGRPILEAVLVLLSVGLGALAYRRGGLPIIDQALGRVPRPPATWAPLEGEPRDRDPVPRETLDEVHDLRERADHLRARIWTMRLRNLWPREAASAKRHRRRAINDLQMERSRLDREADRLERELSEMLYG